MENNNTREGTDTKMLLPIDVMVEISRYLRTTDLLSMRLANKELKERVTSLLNKSCFGNFTTSERIEDVLLHLKKGHAYPWKQLAFSGTLFASESGINVLKRIGKDIIGVKTLYCDTEVGSTLLNYILLDYVPNIKNLNVTNIQSGCNMTEVGKGLKSLEIGLLEGESKLTVKTLLSCGRLNSLKLGFPNLTAVMLNKPMFDGGLANVSTLEIGYANVQVMHLLAIGSAKGLMCRLKSLKIFEWIPYSLCHLQHLITLLEHQKYLQDFSAPKLPLALVADWDYILPLNYGRMFKSTLIQEMEIQYACKLSDITYIKDLRKLTLDISYMCELGDECCFLLEQFINQTNGPNPYVTHLRIRMYEADFILGPTIEFFSNLKYLELCSVPLRSVPLLFASCQKIQTLVIEMVYTSWEDDEYPNCIMTGQSLDWCYNVGLVQLVVVEETEPCNPIWLLRDLEILSIKLTDSRNEFVPWKCRLTDTGFVHGILKLPDLQRLNIEEMQMMKNVEITDPVYQYCLRSLLPVPENLMNTFKDG